MRSFSIVTSVMTLSSAQRPAVLNSDMTNVQANPVQANQHRMLRSMKNADAMESTVITSVGGMGRSLNPSLTRAQNTGFPCYENDRFIRQNTGFPCCKYT